MTKITPHAVYIGDQRVLPVLESIKPEWTFIPNITSIDDFNRGLIDGTIPNEDIQIILILDNFFSPKAENTQFEELVAQMSPYCFFGIVNYFPAHKEAMIERIEYHTYSLGNNESALYYFIDNKDASFSLDNALTKFLSEAKSDTAQYAVEVLSGREVSQVEEEDLIETYNNNQNNDTESSNALGRVIAITSSKGGSGKSTVAISLATYLSHSSINSVKEGLEEKPLKVIILDLDVRDGQLGFLTGNSKPTVINLRINGVSQESIRETVIHSSRLKLDLLLAPKRPRNSDDTPPDFYVELIQNLKKMYDYVILDTSVNYLDPLLEKVAYPIADQIVFVTDIVVNSVFSMTRWIQEVTKPKVQGGMGINSNKIGIVVNKSLADVNMPGEKIARSALGLKVVTVIPSSPRLIAHAANMQSMEMVLKNKDLYVAIRRLAKSVTNTIYKLSDNV